MNYYKFASNYFFLIVAFHEQIFSLNNDIVAATFQIDRLMEYGKITYFDYIVWFENSTLSVNDTVRLFRYQNRYETLDYQSMFVNKLLVSIQMESNVTDEIINNNIHNKFNSTLFRRIIYTNLEDGKNFHLNLEYNNNAVEPISSANFYAAIESSKDLQMSYNQTFRIQILDDFIKFKFLFMNYIPTLSISTVEELISTRTYILCYIATMNKRFQKYLEIGTNDDANFQYMSSEIFPYAVGVDPQRGGTHRMTSDMYFETHTKETFDVIFIDGLHEAHQVYRDVLNALRVLRPNGMILLHDCNPNTEFKASSFFPGKDILWNGDVWKALVALRIVRNDLDIVTIDTDHGVGVIRRGAPTAHLPDHWKETLGDYPIHRLNYPDHLEPHRDELLNLMTIREFKKWFHSSHSNNNHHDSISISWEQLAYLYP